MSVNPSSAALAARTETYLSTITAGYIVFILYGSLYPFSDWTYPVTPLFSFLTAPWFYEIPDLVQNFLVYAPLGLMLMLGFRHRRNLLSSLCMTGFLGLMLSLGVESIQQFLPSRVASDSDLLMNFVGTVCGGLLVAVTDYRTSPGQILMKVRNAWIQSGTSSSIGLIILLLWVLSQTSPFVPSLDLAHFRHGFSLMKMTYTHPEQFQCARLLIYTCNILGIGLLFLTIGKKNKPLVSIFSLLVMTVLFSKIIIVGRLLTLEAVFGALAGLIFLAIFANFPIKIRSIIASMAILLGFFTFELSPGESIVLNPFNWIPLSGQMLSLSGLEDILDFLWPFMALGYFLRIHVVAYKQTEYAFFGGIAVLASVSLMEWSQQYLPGRFGDISQIGLSLIGWIIVWNLPKDEPESIQ